LLFIRQAGEFYDCHPEPEAKDLPNGRPHVDPSCRQNPTVRFFVVSPSEWRIGASPKTTVAEFKPGDSSRAGFEMTDGHPAGESAIACCYALTVPRYRRETDQHASI